MPELTPSTREAARRLGVSETGLRKAEQTNRIAREPDGQWDIDKTRRHLTETADPARSPLASGAAADGTPFARLKVAQLALKVKAQRLALNETKRRLLDVIEANAALDEIGSTMRDALLKWPARVGRPATCRPPERSTAAAVHRPSCGAATCPAASRAGRCAS